MTQREWAPPSLLKAAVYHTHSPVAKPARKFICRKPKIPLPTPVIPYIYLMAIQPILRAGNPILEQVARPLIPADWAGLPQLVTEMCASMAAAGGTGLAAPQIGHSVRLMIFEVTESRTTDHADDAPADMTVLINPSWQILDETQDLGWEGCLSLPGLRGEVPRYRQIRYSGSDLDGTRIERVAGGFHARVFQHEVDHLDGILYPQRMIDMRRFGFTQELLEKMAQPQQETPDEPLKT